MDPGWGAWGAHRDGLGLSPVVLGTWRAPLVEALVVLGLVGTWEGRDQLGVVDRQRLDL